MENESSSFPEGLCPGVGDSILSSRHGGRASWNIGTRNWRRWCRKTSEDDDDDDDRLVARLLGSVTRYTDDPCTIVCSEYEYHFVRNSPKRKIYSIRFDWRITLPASEFWRRLKVYFALLNICESTICRSNTRSIDSFFPPRSGYY